MHVIVERNIPFIEGLLEPFATVTYLESEDITPEAVHNADAIFVRTRTRCDEHLLGGSRCRFVGTATIGLDHIDLPWCADHGITAVNAPGCNAPAVAQYVLGSILQLTNRPVEQYTIGIVGVGHVGSIVERWCRQLEMRVLVNDPPRQATEGGDGWSSLEEIAREADIITFHTPLTADTRHMINTEFLDSLVRHPILINAARGSVADTAAVIAALDNGQIHHAVIDTWEGEPNISRELLKRAAIATPHIAGYSYEGKVRATRMVLDSFCQCFGLPHIEMEEKVPAGAAASVTAHAIIRSYNPLKDTAMLKADPADFERMRNHYPLRREVAAAKID